MRTPRALSRLARVLAASLILVAGSIVSGATAPPAAAATMVPDANFPAKDSRYHNYAEMVAEIHDVADAHPDLVKVFSIGKSYQGRDIWMAKVSDNVEEDEAEPEVLVDALHHAREHVSLEQALYLFHVLIDDYNSDDLVKRLVDGREIYILFVVNPDGAEYDLTGSPYRGWRKNRQPTPGSRSIGTDPNRNYGYDWACCHGSSGNPAAWNYRGPKPWSAPEVRALRNFVASRVIGGRQQIKTHVTLHSNGQLILWPYGHTRSNIPRDMTRVDHNAFVAMGKTMAASNGYKAEQSSDLYITDGDQIDWMYGVYRIFSFTMELWPTEHNTTADFYPADELIASQTARNRRALLYLINLADCPYRSTHNEQPNCGPLYDDFEAYTGWRTNLDGTDTATRGRWERGTPAQSNASGPKQLNTVVSGGRALVTGRSRGSSANANDLDGRSSISSPAVTLPDDPGPLTFRYYFAHSSSSAADSFRVYVEDVDTHDRTKVYEEPGTARDDDAAWLRRVVNLEAFAGKTVRIVFVATDGGHDTLVEAGVDDVRIERPS